MSTAIVWFRRDLRLEDNPALAAALDAHERIVCAYIHAPDEEAPWAPGAASRWWLHHSLAALDVALRRRGAALHIRRGPSLAAFAALLRDSSAEAVYWNRLYEPACAQRDTAVERLLRERGVAAHSFNASLLVEPGDIRTGARGPYKVFTPFWRTTRARIRPTPPIPPPARLATVPLGGSIGLDTLRLRPRPDWAAGFPECWRPGEAGARERLRGFLEHGLAGYADARDRPDGDGTSRLSPHLHFGEIGPRQVCWQIEEALRADGGTQLRAGSEVFLRELGWREFSHHVLQHFPQSPQQNFNRMFDAFAWETGNAAAVEAWQQGRTGIPIIDAGMRQLWQTGWMHNRVRMLTASFLTKNLRRHWLYGARWFWDTLVDADLANNTQGWQWTAGTGADAAPYFRIFNPVRQAERFDPEGAYVRRWVRELEKVAAPLVHQPWRDPGLLRRSGYPAPIVDLPASQAAALLAHRMLRTRSIR